MESVQHATVERFVEEGRTRLLVRGRLTSDSASVVLDWVRSWLPNAGGTVGLDLGEVAYLDSAGVAVLAESLAIAEARGCQLNLVRASDAARAALALFRFQAETAEKPTRPPGFLEYLGNRTLGWWQETRRLFVMLADTLYWALAGPFGKLSGAPAGEMQRQTMILGERAFGIVALLAVLIGATMALALAESTPPIWGQYLRGRSRGHRHDARNGSADNGDNCGRSLGIGHCGGNRHHARDRGDRRARGDGFFPGAVSGGAQAVCGFDDPADVDAGGGCFRFAGRHADRDNGAAGALCGVYSASRRGNGDQGRDYRSYKKRCVWLDHPGGCRPCRARHERRRRGGGAFDDPFGGGVHLYGDCGRLYL